jgi:hypothetical protein
MCFPRIIFLKKVLLKDDTEMGISYFCIIIVSTTWSTIWHCLHYCNKDADESNNFARMKVIRIQYIKIKEWQGSDFLASIITFSLRKSYSHRFIIPCSIRLYLQATAQLTLPQPTKRRGEIESLVYWKGFKAQLPINMGPSIIMKKETEASIGLGVELYILLNPSSKAIIRIIKSITSDSPVSLMPFRF